MTDILEATGQKQLTQQERFEKTRTLVFTESSEACRQLAKEVADLIEKRRKENRKVVLGLATGSTPVPFYRQLVRLHKKGLSFSNVITFNLDEYYGLTQDHPESYYRFMHDQLFDHIDIPKENINIPDGTVSLDEVYDYCHGYERAIVEAGGLDLQILGIGRTGHIGFNEPGSAVDSPTRMITLDRVTRADAAADFLGIANVPRSAITMGVGTIMKADRIVLMAWGGNKASIVRDAVEGPVTDQISASFLQQHEKAIFLVDSAAATRLTRFQYPWLVGSVNWTAPMIKRAVIRLAEEVGSPILKLTDEDYNEHGVGELLASTNTEAYHVNIDVFNEVQHTITGWPGGKKDTENEPRPERAKPVQKNVLVLCPEPSDAIVGMAGTIDRLVEQGHNVRLVVQTSGNLRVRDVSARNFAGVILEMAVLAQGKGWENQRQYADSILEELEEKGEFGIDSALVRRLKGLILRGEARDAGDVCGLEDSDRISFLDLPFYETGRYRRFRLSEEDIEVMKKILNEVKPHSIFATGHVGDPSSMQALCFRAFFEAWEDCKDQAWRKDCYVWLYRGKDSDVSTHEIDMAVPMSPDQLEQKREAIRKFQSITGDEFDSPFDNQQIAKEYDKLGMAEYEAIEAFERWT
ncbi:MAG: glucosamine-6-phosphate deaminase [Verrucomicrobiales bacterium]|nr:glucosamine-6-phosphate deaminase [Verrucomicrobiales bacterium]